MSSVDGMGPGTPTPVSYAPRPIGQGKPLTYSGKSNSVEADVAHGPKGTNVNAQFQLAPPVRTPGTKGLGQSGSHIDAKA